ncbi:MAG: methyltransferase family protein [Vicinamibacterales bacterium]
MRAHAASSVRVARLVSATGALLFFVSLAYFAFVYLMRFDDAGIGEDTAVALTWNVTLFSLFALHHSVFARVRVRRLVSQAVPAGLERSVYVWIASLLFIAVCAWWRPIAGMAWQADGLVLWALRALQAAGVWLTLRSAVILDIGELAGLRRPGGGNSVVAGGLPPSREASADRRSLGGGGQASGTEFKTTGPYGWVRHPIYAGWFLFVWTASPMTMTRLTFAAVSCVYLLIAIPLEERTMRATSGGSYERYMAQVRWRLVPGVY